MMLVEAAITLLKTPKPALGGVLTPSVAMGAALVDRLKTVGMEFAVGLDTR